ncbi:MAG TPA: sigma factor, partial [Phnomibacter sp.]|nr:sigma factor [Phnomibacter sp.]
MACRVRGTVAIIAVLKNSGPYNNIDDKELADMYRSTGDQKVLAVIYARYSDLLFGVCLKYLKDMDSAADACNDIYLELVDKMKRHDVQHVKAWLHTLARNHCLIKLRGDKKMPIDEFPEKFMQSEDFWHPSIAIAEEKEKKLNSLEECIEKL